MTVFLVPKIPIPNTGNNTLDTILIIWAVFSGLLGLGCVKGFINGRGWFETPLLNKIGLFSLIIYLIVYDIHFK